jgi:bifunctional oligoribonuclease and PAP phosphatase NrnA
MNNAWKKIEEAGAITLLTHFRPDGDGVAACAALHHILKNKNKSVEIIYPNKSDCEYALQPKDVLINTHTRVPDLLIICDTANIERAYFPKEFEGIDIINIDHHVSNSIKGTYNFVDGDVSSACELLYKLLNEWDKKVIDTRVAECLLFGMMFDTNVFRTQATNAKTLRVAAELIDVGADLFKLKTELLSNKNPQIISLWGDVLKRITISRDKKSVWVDITQKDLKEKNLTLNSLTGFIDFLSEVSDVDVTALFYETTDGKTKVSLRSKETDVNKLAAQFGGGGHKLAAGILSDKPLKELMDEVTAVLGG